GRRAPFFLHVDVFDPHEPWDPPAKYRPRADGTYEGPDLLLPVMGDADRYSPAELGHIRALYAGEVALVDAWLGRLLEALEGLALCDDTAVMLLSDHGILLGERNRIGKMGGKKENLVGWPLTPEL